MFIPGIFHIFSLCNNQLKIQSIMQIRKGTITGDLKLTLLKLGYPLPRFIFSDPRRNGKAVGVKISNRYYSPSQVQCIVQEMEKLGHQFIRVSKTDGSFGGHRFTFWKGDVYCKNLKKVLE